MQVGHGYVICVYNQCALRTRSLTKPEICAMAKQSTYIETRHSTIAFQVELARYDLYKSCFVINTEFARLMVSVHIQMRKPDTTTYTEIHTTTHKHTHTHTREHTHTYTNNHTQTRTHVTIYLHTNTTIQFPLFVSKQSSLLKNIIENNLVRGYMTWKKQKT